MTFEEVKHQFDNIDVPPIYFHVPGFIGNMRVVNYLKYLEVNHPYVLYPGVTIGSVFDNFPGSIWNGGTLICGGNFTRENIAMIIDYYNAFLNIPLSFTFTNPMIDQMKYCEDLYSNTIAELGNNGRNNILVSSPMLAEYLKKNYKNYTYIRSIIASEDIPYDLENWDMSVLQRAKNNDWDYLNSIPYEDRDRIEILLNDPCPDNCPRLYEHYKAHGELQIQNSLSDEENSKIRCLFYNEKFPRAKMATENKTYISTEDLYGKYVPAGFRHFKFSGRTSLVRGMIGALSYMIRPEFQEDAMMKMFSDIQLDPIQLIRSHDINSFDFI